jgi:(p)ppGpp synthase/HD superfamily hydrolase
MMIQHYYLNDVNKVGKVVGDIFYVFNGEHWELDKTHQIKERLVKWHSLDNPDDATRINSCTIAKAYQFMGVYEILGDDYESLLNHAYAIAKKAHQGQKDKANKAYIYHPTAVSDLIDRFSPSRVLREILKDKDQQFILLAKVVGYLHDVIEDSEITYEDLLNKYNIPKVCCDAVKILSKTKGIDYNDYLIKVRENDLSRVVKIADITHNSDLSRIESPSKEDFERLKKYGEAINMLL